MEFREEYTQIEKWANEMVWDWGREGGGERLNRYVKKKGNRYN